MYEADLSLLRCPRSGQPLEFADITERAADGEIVAATLRSSAAAYPVTGGIPRFVEDTSYNPSWDFKWRVLDAGRGLNYRILDRSDPAYSIHDIYDRNSHDGHAFDHMGGRLVLDIGCGVGQYAVKSLLEHDAAKVVAVDLTGGVDVFRKIVQERYPQLLPRLLIVQASVFALPFPAGQFDYVYSLGVLMHTGETMRALDCACAQLAAGGEINVWLYGSEPLAYDAEEQGREDALTLGNVGKFVKRMSWPMYWIHLFRRSPNSRALRIVKWFSSDWAYRMGKTKLPWIARIFPTVDHPDYEYRLINNYDGYVNNWADTWSEHDVFPVFRRHSIAILGISGWRVGLWGRKIAGFYPTSGVRTDRKDEHTDD